MTGFLAALALTLSASTALAQTPEPPEGLVWMALRDINEQAFDPDDPTNRPPLVTEVPDGMITAMDISPDGRSDWLVDYAAAGMSSWCGTGGCLKRLYVSTDDGYVRAFDNQALALTYGPRLRMAVGQNDVAIEVWVHHGYCSDDSRECRYGFGWDASDRRFVQRWTTSPRPMDPETGFKPISPPAG